MLAQHLGDVVLIDDLIDETAPNLTSAPDRFRQRVKVGTYVSGLRKSFDDLIVGAGDVEHGVLQTEFGKGFWLAEHWHPVRPSADESDSHNH